MKYRYDTPIEQKRSMKYGNNYYKVYSRKIGRVVTGYSNLEYYNLIALEMDPDVEWYCEQPVEAHLYDSLGNDEKCIPDVYVYYKDGREEIQEVKYSSEYEGDSKETLLAWSQRRKEEKWSNANRMDFVVRTEKDLIVGKSVQNLCYLCNRVRVGHIPDEALRQEVFKYVNTPLSKGTTFSDIKDYIDKPYSTVMDCIAHMYWKGMIDIPDVFSDSAIHFNSTIIVRSN